MIGRVVKEGKLSSFIVIYLQVLTILAENIKQIDSKFYASKNRTLNSSLVQELSKFNQLNTPLQINNANLNLSDNLSPSLPSSIINGDGFIQSNGEDDVELSLAPPSDQIDGGEQRNETSTVILEDLVNRFFEKNSDAMRKGSLAQTNSDGGNSGEFSDDHKDDNHDDNYEDDYATKQVNHRNHSNDGQTNDSFVNSDGISTTPSPFIQLISAKLNEGGEERKNNLLLASQQEISDDIDTDRHIQYDVIEPEQVTDNKQKLHPRHVKNELNVLKLTNYTTITDNNGTILQGKGEQQQLSDINSQLIELGQNVSSLSKVPEQNQIFAMNSSDENWSKNEPRQQQIVSAANSSVVPRIVQARSMSSNIVASLNKTPQYTRPPYATYDQFSHRSDINSNNKQVYNEQVATPTTGPSSSNSTTQQSGIRNKTSASNVRDAVTLVNSISRISSQLVSDTAKGDLAKQKQQQQQIVVEKEQIQEQQQNADEESNNNNNNNSDNKKFQQQQQLHKLATSDQLVELNPIPMSDQAVPPGSEQMQLKQGSSLQDGGDRFYFSKENQLFNYFSPPNQNLASARGQSVGVDKYNGGNNNNNFNKDQDQDSSASVASNFFNVNEISSNHQQLAKLAGQYPGHDNNKLSSMIDSKSNHEQYDKLLNERMRESQVNQNQNNNPNKHHYAASLINVTAPMILPLSATEAMESALGDQAAKNLLHQVSGFLRSPSSASDQLVKSTATATKLNQPPRSSQYYVAPMQTASSSLSSSLLPSDSRLPASQQQQQPIYSQPANQFSPPKIHSTSNEAANLATASSDSYLEERMRLNRNGYIMAGRKPPDGYSATSQLNANVNLTTHQASGFRSPLPHPTTIQGGTSSSSSPGHASSTPVWPSTRLPSLSSYLSGSLSSQMAAVAAAASERPPPTTITNMISSSSSLSSLATPSSIFASDSRINSNGAGSTLAAITNEHQANNSTSRPPPPPPPPPHTQSDSQQPFPGTATTGSMNGMINVVNGANNNVSSGQSNSGEVSSSSSLETSGLTRPIFNLTRVEHISAECSNDLIRTVIIFNGTFKGIIYSSGYVRDPSCVYINGTGKTRYQFNIRLNQCGTLGRQELHPPVGPNEIRRRDQVMWNTLSIQYNPIIEQEWDEHFRVSCEYGSDFWKTVSFNPFNVETNTGSPVVFTVDPPQCQMEILRGHGMVGPRQEAVSGPVTVGDPLTLLIHMKSEKAGYDILVKNCIAHNGGHQKMQLIDNNGCVVNERFISPFRGTYNDNDMKHVTLYSYLKAFRFTGSPVLYLECEIHMCQSSCPPQMCYWRRLSKRSALNETTTTTPTPNGYPMLESTQVHAQTLQYQDDLSNQEFSTGDETKADRAEADSSQLGNKSTNLYFESRNAVANRRQLRMLNFSLGDEDEVGYNVATGVNSNTLKSDRLLKGGRSKSAILSTTTEKPLSSSGQMSDKVSLFQALEVRQEREPENAPFSSSYSSNSNHITAFDDNYFNNTPVDSITTSSLTCYRRAEILAFLFTTIAIILVALSISVGFCWRAANLRKMQRQDNKTIVGISGGLSSANLISRMSSINNLLCKNVAAATNDTSSMSSCSTASPTSSQHQHQHHHQQLPHHHHHHHHQHCNADSSWTSHPTAHQLRLSPILQHHSVRYKERPL